MYNLIERLRFRRHWKYQANAQCLEIPFPEASLPFANAFRIGVVLHLYYPDMAPEFADYLRNIPQSYDLMITTDTLAKRQSILTSQIGNAARKTEVKLVENVGRDIAPKLAAFSGQYANYDLLLFLHSKHSDYSSGLANWRTHLLQNLVGSVPVTTSILALFAKFPDLGIVAPMHFKPIRPSVSWGINFRGCKKLADRFGVKLQKFEPMNFPSGSMFWARPKALAPILDLKLEPKDFEREQGQRDGTLAHWIERLFFYACLRAGYTWIMVTNGDRQSCKAKSSGTKNFRDIAQMLRLNRLF